MFTEQERDMLVSAVEMAVQSQKRAQNSSKSPQLLPVYKSIQADLEALIVKLKAIKIPR